MDSFNEYLLTNCVASGAELQLFHNGGGHAHNHKGPARFLSFKRNTKCNINQPVTPELLLRQRQGVESLVIQAILIGCYSLALRCVVTAARKSPKQKE